MQEPGATTNLQTLYYYIQQRVETDWTTDPVMAIVLTIVTCGIYGFYVFYKLMQRRDDHFMRVSNMANTAVALLRERATQMGRLETISQELQQLEMVQRGIYDQSRERGAALWLVIAILTGGIGYWIGFYLLMDDYGRHDQLEAQFFTLMSSSLTKLGLSTSASQATLTIPEREFVVMLLLTIVTC